MLFNEIIFLKTKKGESLIGSPIVKDIVIKAKVIDQIKDKKIIVFKKKRRHNYRRKIGHRQDLTLLKIEEIQQKKVTTKTTSVNNKKPTAQSIENKGESNGT